MVRVKKAARRVNIMFRNKAFTERERKKSKILMNAVADILLTVPHAHPLLRRGGLFLCFILLVNTFRVMCDFGEREVTPDRLRTINSFSEGQCWNYFETRKEDLSRLLACLRIPEIVRLKNRKVRSSMLS